MYLSVIDNTGVHQPSAACSPACSRHTVLDPCDLIFGSISSLGVVVLLHKSSYNPNGVLSCHSYHISLFLNAHEHSFFYYYTNTCSVNQPQDIVLTNLLDSKKNLKKRPAPNPSPLNSLLVLSFCCFLHRLTVNAS